ncbi:hypothetical protein HDU97_002481 [Phlyctochytrium planicorne]|nr:hypothetical protein HDU97_002481 [Phlyctochytrium planicorne]
MSLQKTSTPNPCSLEIASLWDSPPVNTVKSTAGIEYTLDSPFYAQSLLHTMLQDYVDPKAPPCEKLFLQDARDPPPSRKYVNLTRKATQPNGSSRTQSGDLKFAGLVVLGITALFANM